MTLDEATAIAEQARLGRLDANDESIARQIAEANLTVVRSQMWGGTPRERRSSRLLVITLFGAAAFFAAGLAVAFVFSRF